VEFRTQIARLRAKLEQFKGPESLIEFDQTVRRPVVARPQNGMNVYIEPRMTNEQLAHELLFDPEFQLDDSGNFSNPVANQIRKSFHEAFWAR